MGTKINQGGRVNMKVYIVYEIFQDNTDDQEWFNYESSIDSVYIDKNKALERATEIFNAAKNELDFIWNDEVWEKYGPRKPEDIISEYDVQ
jgi:hypothetical protein